MLAYCGDWVDGPVAFEFAEFEPLAQFLQIDHGDVSLVGDYQHDGLVHVGVAHNSVELFGSELDSLQVGTIDNVDEGSGLVEIVGP